MIKGCKISRSDEIVYQRDSKDNKKLINGYKVIKVIGEGAYAKIKLAEKDGIQFAIKKINKYLLRKKNKMYRNPDGTTKYVTLLDEVYREMEVHQRLQHDNVVQLIEIMDDEKRDKLYAVLEYAKIGQILDWDHKKAIFKETWPFNEAEFKEYFRQCLVGLQYLYSQYVVHRDIKPHNILIDAKGCIKYCDFGCAQQLTSHTDRVKGTEGTFQFVAPECLREKKDGDIPGYDGFAADVWSLGVVMYCIVDKVLPFQSDIMLELFKQIETKEITMMYDGPARQIILSMLNRDTKTRPKPQELLQNAYFN